MTILRGKSDDSPTIAMRIEKGRLVPVSAFDAELLAQWHEGAELNVEAKRIRVRVLERKYFAMLSRLLKVADTPWSNTDTAHEALKLAAGFVEPYKKKNGEWGAHPRHIATFTDAELSEYVEIFYGIILRRFGIDPETLGQEASDTGLESSGAGDTAAADDGPSAHPIPVGAGLPPRSPAVSPAGVPETGGTLESTPRDVPSVDGPKLRPEEWDWLKQAARMLVAATEPGGEVDIVDRQVMAIKNHLTPASISPEAKEIAQYIYRHCRAVCRGDRPLDQQWVADRAHCKVSDLRPEAR
jgi:hypothetical protein